MLGLKAIQGLLRGTIDRLVNAAVGSQGDLLVSNFLPRYARLVAEGRVWRAQEATATASVIALPTTAGLFTVGNNSPDDGAWYVGIAVYAFNAANAAALDAFGLAACVSQLPAVTGGLSVTMAQDIAKTSVKGLGGVRQGAYNGYAILDEGVTVTDDLWFPLGQSVGSTAVISAKGMTQWVWLDGLIVLPPKTMVSFVSTATSTSNTTRKGFIWAEVPKNWLRSD